MIADPKAAARQFNLSVMPGDYVFADRQGKPVRTMVDGPAVVSRCGEVTVDLRDFEFPVPIELVRADSSGGTSDGN